MQPTGPLQVDLASREDIREKLPEARRILEAKQEALEEAQREVREWSLVVQLLAHLAGEQVNVFVDPSAGTGFALGNVSRMLGESRGAVKDAPAQDRAIAGLERAGQPMGPTALYRFMQNAKLEVPTNANALGAALWNAFKSGRVKKTPDGLYALLDWDTDQPELEDLPRERNELAPDTVAAEIGGEVRDAT